MFANVFTFTPRQIHFLNNFHIFSGQYENFSGFKRAELGDRHPGNGSPTCDLDNLKSLSNHISSRYVG